MLSAVDRRPRYVQAAEALAGLIDSSFESGDILPPADQLAQQIGVSRSTLREAMSYLERDGRLIRKQGLGTFVAKATAGHLVNRLEHMSGLRNLAQAAGLPMEVVEFEMTTEPAAGEWAASLELEADKPLIHTQVVTALAGQRVAFFDSRVDAERVVADVLAGGRQTLLEHLLACGKSIPFYTDSRIMAVKADEGVAGRLAIKPGDAILKMAELLYSAEGKPLVFQHAYLLTDYLDYRLVRRVVRPLHEG
jgi:GntR family transcriptional regulator